MWAKAFTGGKQEMEEGEEGKEWERRALEECTRCVLVEINLRVTCLMHALRGFRHTTITYSTATTSILTNHLTHHPAKDIPVASEGEGKRIEERKTGGGVGEGSTDTT